MNTTAPISVVTRTGDGLLDPVVVGPITAGADPLFINDGRFRCSLRAQNLARGHEVVNR